MVKTAALEDGLYSIVCYHGPFPSQAPPSPDFTPPNVQEFSNLELVTLHSYLFPATDHFASQNIILSPGSWRVPQEDQWAALRKERQESSIL